jgi:hypothetical protein
MFKRRSERVAKEYDPYDIPDGTMLIDLSQISMSIVNEVFDARVAQPKVDEVETVILNTIRANVKKHKMKYPEVVICVDSKIDYWRKTIAPYYKGNRKKARDATKLDYKIVFEGLANVIANLNKHFPYKVIEVDTLEADDIIGVLSRSLCQTRPVLIVSSDGDFTQLHNANVKQYSPLHKKLIGHKHGSNKQDLLYKIIKGDRKDCVSNIKSMSDHIFTAVPGGPKQSQISAKFLDEVMMDPRGSLTDIEYARFKENEKLIDLSYTPSLLQDKVVARYETNPIGTHGDVYRYFLTTDMSYLLENSADF